MKGIKAAASVISLFLLSSCGSVYTDSMNLLYSVPLPLFIKERVVQTAAPRFDVADTEFEDPFSLTLTSDTPGADIYYTTDGSEPDGSNGILFRNLIPVSETMTIKAIAVKEGYAKSNVVDRWYEKCEYDIYISGMISQRIAVDEGVARACYWKNAELYLLDNSSNVYGSEVHQIEMFNHQLYNVGSFPDVSINAGYWINDNYVELTGSSKIYGANSIYFNGSDMYIAGEAWDESTQMQRACYWLNGTINFVGDIGVYSRAKRILIYNGIVFILGYYLDNSYNSHECYWMNGVFHNIGVEDLTPYANDLYVINENIYIAGSQKNNNGITIACYWKNGIKYDIGDGIVASMAESIIITNINDVYIAGSYDSYGSSKACYWENGEIRFLDGSYDSDTQMSTATAITEKHNNVYIAGFIYTNSKCNACYWKNGIRKDVYSADLPLVVTSIVVEKKQPN